MKRILSGLAAALLVTGVVIPAAQAASSGWTARSAVDRVEVARPDVPNPYLAFGADVDGKDAAAWQHYLAANAPAELLTTARPRTVSVTESEPNDTPATADNVPGFGVDADPDAEIQGVGAALANGTTAAEDNGDTGSATPVTLAPGNGIAFPSTIGDGPHGLAGTGNGDVDVYQLALVAGDTLDVVVAAQVDGSDLDSYVEVLDAAGNTVAFNDDAFGLDSALSYTATSTETHYVLVSAFGTFGLSDPADSSTAGGAVSEGPYTLQLVRNPSPDHFAVTLAAGDVLVAALDAPGAVAILDPSETLLMESGFDLSTLVPSSSPIEGTGFASAHVVADAPGTYFVRVEHVVGPYTLFLQGLPQGNLRLREDRAEVVYLDFDGAFIPADTFGPGFPAATLSPLEDFLLDYGLTPADEDDVIDAVIASVEESLHDDLQGQENGDHEASGTAGEFDVDIRNSRDHPDTFGQPGISRVVIGGTIPEFGVPTIGLAQSIDIGNYSPNETGVVLLDLLLAPACDSGSELLCHADGGTDLVDLAGTGIGNIVTHEIGHFIGNLHTDSLNAQESIMDEGGDLGNSIGAGTDDVFGNGDDVDVDLVTDQFSQFEGLFGEERTRPISAFALSTGTVTTNTPPVPAPDVFSFQGLPPFAVAAPGVLANDGGGEFDPILGVDLASGPAAGDVVVNDDGSFTYTPTSLDDQQFTYTSTDKDGASAPTTVDVGFLCGTGSGLANPSFEEGDVPLFPGWCSVNETSFPAGSFPEGVGDFDGQGFFLTEPTDGDRAFLIDWPFFGPGHLDVEQSFYIPDAATGARLVFDWRAAWNLDVGCGPCGDLDYIITLTDAFTGDPIDDEVLLTMAADSTDLDNGPQTATVDLDGLSGRSVTFKVNLDIPGDPGFPGYGQLQLDNFLLDVDLPPTTAPDTYTVPFDGTRTVSAGSGVLDNDAAVGGGPLTAALIDAPVNGTVALNANGGFTYTHDGSATLTDSFTYAASDADATSAPTKVTITVGTDEVVRLAGDDRIATSVEISQSSRPSAANGRATGVTTNAVVLARADNFADGLAGTPFAASLDAPVLLTFPNELHPTAEAEIERVLAPGGTVYLLGGEVALSAAVADAVDALGFDVERIQGETRYDTAVEIAERLGDVDTILVARGDAFPDALAAGPAAIASGASIVLTTPEVPSPVAQAYLNANPGADVFATGGPAARAFPSATPLSGETRHETAVLIAEEFFDDPPVAALAVSNNFADALSGGVHVGLVGGPVLLTPNGELDPAVAAYVTAGSDDLRVGFVYGGPVALADAVETAFRNAIQ